MRTRLQKGKKKKEKKVITKFFANAKLHFCPIANRALGF